MSRSLKSPPPIIFIFLAVIAWLGIKNYPHLTKNVQSTSEIIKPRDNHADNKSTIPAQLNNSAESQDSLSYRISWGEQLFIDTASPLKEQGIKALQQQNTQQAITLWQKSLAQFPNDPETVIYLNNALIGNSQSYSIVVSAPIGVDVDTAQEILRGVAQAQQEVNAAGGVNGIPLRVVIANDDNDPKIAQKLAQSLAKNLDILGVVGHFSSDVTLAAATEYEQAGLVAISPTSTSVSISGAGKYIFRTVPSDRFAGNTLAKHLLEKLNKQNAAVFYASESNYSNSLKDTFSTDLVSNGGQVVAEFDLTDSSFSPDNAFTQAKERGAEALILLATSSTLDSALSIAEVNNRQLPLLAGDDVYTAKTLKTMGEKATEMVVAIPWHIRGNVNPDFPQKASNLWQAEVNWRTALAYDATQVLIAGLQTNPSRQGIQETLAQSQFSIIGASGEISFLPSGDRNQKPQLVQVQPGNSSGFGYDFVPID